MKNIVTLGLMFIILQLFYRHTMSYILQSGAKGERQRRSAITKYEYVPEPEEQKCIDELQLDKNKIGKLVFMPYNPENDDDYTKYKECYWTKKGYLDGNGKINYDALKQMIVDLFSGDFDIDFVKTYADAGVEQCRDIEAEPVGLKVIKTDNCILKALRDIGQG